MKQYVVLLDAFFLALLITSCSSNLPLDSQADSGISPYRVSLTTAKDVALAFMNERTPLSVTKSTSNSILSTSTFKGQQGQDLAFIVTFSTGGYVLVSADNRLDPILGYSETGVLPEDKAQLPVGFQLWLEGLEETLARLDDDSSEPDPAVASFWDRLLPTNTKVVPLNPNPPALIDTTVGPLLTSTWHQWDPYNWATPMCYIDSLHQNIHAPAGCAPLAIARIMHYHQYPNIFYWADIPNSGATANTAALFESIYNNLGSEISFGANATTVSSSFNPATFLSVNYGYTYAQRCNYSSTAYLTMKDELLTYQRPVILSGRPTSGDGHYWVCDGVHYYQTCTELDDGSFVTYGHLYFHHAWGYDSSLDAWLSSSAQFTVDGTTFSQSLKLCYHLYP